MDVSFEDSDWEKIHFSRLYEWEEKMKKANEEKKFYDSEMELLVAAFFFLL